MPSLIVLIVIFFSIFTPVSSSGEINLNSGHLSASESFKLKQMESVFNNSASDLTLQRYSSDADLIQDATMTVMGIRKKWSDLSPEFKEIASEYFLSKSSSVNNLYRQKTLMRNVKSVRGAHLLPNWVETTDFNIGWGMNPDQSDIASDSSERLSC